MVLRRSHEGAPKASALARGIDCKHAEVAAVRTRLDVDASHEHLSGSVAYQEKYRVRAHEPVVHVGIGGARPVKHVRLDEVGEVDDADQCVDVC
jgi:hypothetical protein